MCEQTEISYLDGDVVWVKLGSCWWPGEVVAPDKLPPDVLRSFRKPPIAVVKFFQEDTYEYVKNINSIYKYNCSRKNEFINKGLYMYRTKHGPMEKFPEDVIQAETAVGGDIEILTRDEFQETKKESYAGLFGEQKKTPITFKRGRGRGRPSESPRISTPLRKVKEKSDYKVHILLQGSATPSNQNNEEVSNLSTSCADSVDLEENNKNNDNAENAVKPDTPEATQDDKPVTSFSTPTISSSGMYSCHACSFSTSRLNVLILHNKTHSVKFMPYTPSPVKKKPTKSPVKTTPISSKTPKTIRPRKEKSDKLPKKTSQGQKRTSEASKANVDNKKAKTDQEIKSSLLADWDDVDEESNDEASAMGTVESPEIAVAAESPAVPTPAELPSAQVPVEIEKKTEDLTCTEKPESSSDSKYEFCEDEDWPVETDVGRKIPRIKSKRKDETKSINLEDDDMAREVAELLNKTTVPELPSVPEPLKVEENFPEPSVVKSPDKQETLPESLKLQEKPETPPTKAIFKTKTFFRSRHSRSQDAIGKYVAEQLNAVERMDLSENEINGCEAVSSPEARESPPIEHVKVARLAPKIQLKKMKAEAAQLREKEKMEVEVQLRDDAILKSVSSTFESTVSESNTKVVVETPTSPCRIQDVLYPTQEIKPVTEHKVEDNETSPVSESNVENNHVKDVIQSIANTVGCEAKENVSKLIAIVNENQEIQNKEHESIGLELKESNETKEPEPSQEPYMNESTASAVDALLSVSREADRVTRVISDDLPEDLFEDDHKENGISNMNGFNETAIVDHVDKIDFENKSSENKSHVTELNESKALEKIEVDQLVDSEENVNKGADEIITQTFSLEDVAEIEHEHSIPKVLTENIPSESDLQIAEALINLPATAIKKNSDNQEAQSNPLPLEVLPSVDADVPPKAMEVDNESFESKEETRNIETDILLKTALHQDTESVNSVRFETELEKSENLNAAQSLVQMSESVDHKINIIDTKNTLVNSNDIPENELFSVKQNNGIDAKTASIEQKVASLSKDNSSETANNKPAKYETTSSKLLKILEEPCTPKITKPTISKQIVMPGKEKILNFDVAKSSFKTKTQSPVIIRRATNKNIINNMTEINSPEKIILSRSNKQPQDGSGVQTFTIQTSPDTPPDSNTITIIQQKVRKVPKPPTKLQKIKPQNSLITPKIEAKTSKGTDGEEQVFDINSMPIVLSDEILTPESIDKMPIVMTDGNLITNSSNPPKLVKTKAPILEPEKPVIHSARNKPELKTLLMNPVSEVNKVATPNILSKSSKLRGAKPMLVIDKTTGKQKIIMTQAEPTAVKEIKPTPTLIQPVPQNTGKSEKFLILPTAPAARQGRTQKIVIDPQTGKAHVLVAKGPESSLNMNDNKPVSAKLIPSSSDGAATGNTVMIITNAQGAQSRIVLTSEHEKILFPNKQQPNVSQLKTVTHRINSAPPAPQKTLVSTPQIKTQTRIVPKQKGAIITSKGQLIVGGRVASTAQNIAPMPEIRPIQKRIVPAEPKKIVQTIQKASSEPLIFLQQKSGNVVQLTASQFEHFQRTGQIIQKIPVPAQESRTVMQKTITITPGEPLGKVVQKQRVRKPVMESPAPAKKIKHEIAIAPAHPTITPMPALTPLSNTVATTLGPSISNTVSVTTTSSYSNLENFEEMLPSTAIARQQEAATTPPEAAPPLTDGQLLAVPGEHFGGPPGSFYLCVEDNGTLTPIDNRPLVLENNQLVPMAVEPMPVLSQQPERRDILEAALANSDVFHADPPRDEAPDFRDLNANVSVHCCVSATSTTLNQPIMTPVEVPTKVDSEPAVPSNLEDGLAVIGVTPHTVPTSLELPITVTDPRIAPKTTDPLSGTHYGTSLLPSPNTPEMTYITTEEVDVPMGGPISMPLLTDDESVGKSMPSLTDEVAERTVSSVESTIGSPSSIDVRESEMDDGGQWSRRLLTPGSDTSETSTEIPLQPSIQLSVNDMSRHS